MSRFQNSVGFEIGLRKSALKHELFHLNLRSLFVSLYKKCGCVFCASKRRLVLVCYIDFTGVPQVQKRSEMAQGLMEARRVYYTKGMKGASDFLGWLIRTKLEGTGRYFVFVGTIFRCSLKRPFRFSRCLSEIEHLGVNSVLIIIFSGGAIGMIFALQMVSLLQPFQAEIGTGAAVAVALSREMAPVITTLMLIAKNGSAMAAELGTMRVTEQIDALESMSISAVQYLVLPKVIASFLVFPLLTLLANLVGVLGAYMISIYLFDLDAASYIDYMFGFLSPRDVFVGLIKATVMGFIVATICCFHGIHASQGAKGVGDSATNAVVASSVAILVADYMLTTISYGLYTHEAGYSK